MSPEILALDLIHDTSLGVQIAVIILSGGGAAAVYTLVKAYLAIRQDADMREEASIAMIDKWRVAAEIRADECLADLDRELAQGAYWRRRVGVLEHVLARHGIEPPPPPPVPIGADHDH